MRKIKYTIPTKKEEITLNQFMIFEQVNSDIETTDQFKLYRTIEIFTSIPFDYVSKLKQTEIDGILSQIKPLLNHQPQLYPSFNYKGVKYGLIPDFSKDLLAGEFIDLDVYTEQKRWLEVMSILYRPITFERKGQYLIEPYLATHTDFKDLPFHYFVGVISFFLNLFNSLADLTQRYTEEQLQMLTSQLKVNFNNDIMAMST